MISELDLKNIYNILTIYDIQSLNWDEQPYKKYRVVFSGFEGWGENEHKQFFDLVEPVEFKHVYILKQDGVGVYKMGISKNVQKRLSNIQSSNPKKIELIYKRLVPFPIELERLLKATIKDKRIRGEWYVLNKNDLNELICKLDKFKLS